MSIFCLTFNLKLAGPELPLTAPLTCPLVCPLVAMVYNLYLDYVEGKKATMRSCFFMIFFVANVECGVIHRGRPGPHHRHMEGHGIGGHVRVRLYHARTRLVLPKPSACLARNICIAGVVCNAFIQLTI